MVFIYLLPSFIACLFASLHGCCCCRVSDLRQSKKFHAAALNSNISVPTLLTQYHYQSNISNCQLWEMLNEIVHDDNLHLVCHDCFASIFHPPTFPEYPGCHVPPSAPVLLLLSGLPDLALSAHVLGLQLSERGRLGDKRQSFSTLDVGLVWLFFRRQASCLARNRMWCK